MADLNPLDVASAVLLQANWTPQISLAVAAAAAASRGATQMSEVRFDVGETALPPLAASSLNGVAVERIVHRAAANSALAALAARATIFPALFVGGVRVETEVIAGLTTATTTTSGEPPSSSEQLRTYVRRARASSDDLDAHFNAGALLHQQGLPALAVEMFGVVAEKQPSDVTAHCMLKEVLFPLVPSEVVAVYSRMLERSPENVRARHALAVLTGEGESAQRAAPSYVAEVFDGLADCFEEKLVSALEYRVPWILRNDVDAHVLPAAAATTTPLPLWRRGVDLGCGTGICGRLFRPYFTTATADYTFDFTLPSGEEIPVAPEAPPLDVAKGDGCFIGVDLSPKMVAKAMAAGGYSETRAEDVHLTLAAEAADALDCVISADTFIYVGDLRRCFELTAEKLRRGGVFAFSTETLAFDGSATAAIGGGGGSAGFALVASGRFAHTPAHVRALLDANGLELRSERNIVVRNESRTPIPGVAWVATKI
jgi:predicted TPR repeat methyltransferase